MYLAAQNRGILHAPDIGLPNKMQYSQSLYNPYEDSEVGNEAEEAQSQPADDSQPADYNELADDSNKAVEDNEAEDGDTEDNEAEEVSSSTTRDAYRTVKRKLANIH